MRIVTWNIRSLYRTDAFRELKEECQKYRWDVVALQEVRWPGRGMVEGKDYVLYYSGGEHRHELGTAFLIRKKYLDAIMDFRPIDERLCVLRIRGRYYNTTLVNAHEPTKEKDIQVKEDFYEKLERACDQSPKYDAKIILGDFNAQIGKEEHHRPTIGMHSMHASSNDNGERLVNYAISKQLVIASTHHPHKSIHKGTWKSPGGEMINQIDHVMIDARHRSNI
ncbi:Craniofacial development protein 2 [Formica fusca]